MKEFRYPLTTNDRVTQTNNRALMDWLRANIESETSSSGGSSETTTNVARLDDLDDVNAGDPEHNEFLGWDSGSQRWIARAGVAGPPGATGPAGEAGSDGVASLVPMMLLGGM